MSKAKKAMIEAMKYPYLIIPLSAQKLGNMNKRDMLGG